MASVDGKLELVPSDEFKKALGDAIAELRAARETLSEERIRGIVREELAKWEKQQLQRARFGLPLNMETK